MNKEELREFVTEHINKGAWQVVLQFVAELLEPDSDTKVSNSDLFTELLPTPTTECKECDLVGNWDFETRTMACWPAVREDTLLALNLCKCLYEIDVKQHSAVQTELVEISFDAVKLDHCSLSPVDFGAVVHVVKNAMGMLCMNLERIAISLDWAIWLYRGSKVDC